MPQRWAADPSYRLLQFSHGLWMARNHYLHEKDEQGLLLKEGQSLRDAITARFDRGPQALLPSDHHLLEDRPLSLLLSSQPADKYTWLHAITLTHDAAHHERSSEEGRMRSDMHHFICTGQCRPPSTPINHDDDAHSHHTDDITNHTTMNNQHTNNNEDDDDASQVDD
jgi:hypothetical protein